MQGADQDEQFYDDADRICVVSIARRVCGADAAKKLIDDFGGTRIFIPKDLRQNHPLCRSLGVERAQAIAAECFGVHSYVAMRPADRAERRRALVQLLAAEGKTKVEIARLAHCSERVVYRDFAVLRERGVTSNSIQIGAGPNAAASSRKEA